MTTAQILAAFHAVCGVASIYYIFEFATNIRFWRDMIETLQSDHPSIRAIMQPEAEAGVIRNTTAVWFSIAMMLFNGACVVWYLR